MASTNACFEEFLQICGDVTDQDTEVLTLIRKRFNKAKPKYTSSEEFNNVLSQALARIAREPANKYLFIKDVVNELKAYGANDVRQRGKRTASDTDGESASKRARVSASVTSDSESGFSVTKVQSSRSAKGRLSLKFKSKPRELNCGKTVESGSGNCTNDDEERGDKERKECGIAVENVDDAGDTTSAVPGISNIDPCMDDLCTREQRECVTVNGADESAQSRTGQLVTVDNSVDKEEFVDGLPDISEETSHVIANEGNSQEIHCINVNEKETYENENAGDAKGKVVDGDECEHDVEIINCEEEHLKTYNDGENGAVSSRLVNSSQTGGADTDPEPVINADPPKTEAVDNTAAGSHSSKQNQVAGGSGSDATSKSKEKSGKGSKKQVQRLENLLKEIRDKIERLEEEEMTLDDLDNEDTNYILVDRYKKKFVQVWNKLCDVKGRTTMTGRVTDYKFRYEGSRYPEINKMIERFVNKRKLFPDYQDIREIILRCNFKFHLKLSKKLIEMIARDTFTDVGNRLQERRHNDFISNFGCGLLENFKVYDDPALFDKDLRKRLGTNKTESNSKMEEVLSKYAHKQETGQDFSETEDDEDDDEGDDKETKKNKKGAC